MLSHISSSRGVNSLKRVGSTSDAPLTSKLNKISNAPDRSQEFLKILEESSDSDQSDDYDIDACPLPESDDDNSDYDVNGEEDQEVTTESDPEFVNNVVDSAEMVVAELALDADVTTESNNSETERSDTEVESESTGENFLDFLVDAHKDEYNTLTNSEITGHRICLHKNLLDRCVGYIEHHNAEFVDAYPGVAAASFCDSGNTVTGYLKIEPRTVKPFEMTNASSFIFWLLSGELIVRSTAHQNAGSERILYGKTMVQGSCILVPGHTPYTLENRTSLDVLIGYVLVNPSSTNAHHTPVAPHVVQADV